VTGLKKSGKNRWLLRTQRGEHLTRTVVVAAGVGAFMPRAFEEAGPEELAEKGIYFKINNVERFRDKKVVIIGAGDNSIEWAARLAPVASSVLLANRLNRFGGEEGLPARLAAEGVQIKFPYYELKEIHGGERVESVTVVNSKTGSAERIEVDALLLNVGFIVNLLDFESWGLKVSGNSLVVNERMQTDLEGVYAAGDIVSYNGKLKLISIAASEVATAVADIAAVLARRERARRLQKVERAMETPGRFYSGFEAVQMAIALVRNSVNFCRAAVLAGRDEAVKYLFALLQRDGLNHLETLRDKVLPQYSGGGYAQEDLDDTALAYLRDAVDPFVFGGHRLAEEAAKSGIPSDLDAIYMGIRVHEDSVAFFERLVREPSLKKSHEEFTRLLQSERGHLEMLLRQQKILME